MSQPSKSRHRRRQERTNQRDLIADLAVIEAEQLAQLGADRDLVDLLLGIDRGLSGGTIDFIESIGSHVAGGSCLTTAQRETAEAILLERGL